MQENNYFVPPKFIIEGAEDMMKKNYPPLEFLVDGLLPKTSLVTLNANPKTGKSLLTEQLASTVSDEDYKSFLKHNVKIHGNVLLLALEDTPQRLSDRLKKQSIGRGKNSLQICTRWTQGIEGIKDLDVYITQNPETVLVVIDTLQCFRGNLTATDYATDYHWMNSLKRISDEHHICIILVHHLRKTKSENDDEINQISGTMGISGAADVNIILERQRRSLIATLKVSGRDMEDYAQKLKINSPTLTWYAIDDEKNIDEEKLTPERQKILDILNSYGGIASPKDIAARYGGDSKNVSNMLTKMAELGLVTHSNTKRGFWKLPNVVEQKDFFEEPEKKEEEKQYDIF